MKSRLTLKLCKLPYLGSNTISFSVTALAYLPKATYQMLHSDAPWTVKKIELLANLSNSKLLKLLNIKSAKVFFFFASVDSFCFLFISLFIIYSCVLNL